MTIRKYLQSIHALLLLAILMILMGIVLVAPVTGQTGINFAEQVNGSIDVGGEEDSYTFTATAQQVLIFDDQTTPCCDFNWKLLAPNSSTIFDKGLNGDLEYNAPTTGTYTLIVSGQSAGDTGAYQFTLYTETSDDNGSITIDNATATNGELAIPGELDTFTFTAEAQQIVIFDDQTTPCCDFRWQLVAPNASTIFDKGLNGDLEYSLPQAGTYTITVYRSGPTEIGPYQFQLWKESTQEIDLEIDNISSTPGELTIPGEIDIYSFEAVAGQTLSFIDQTTPCCDFRWRLEDPLGNEIFESGLNGNKEFVANKTGTFKLYVYRAGPTEIGSYQFQVTANPLDLTPTPEPTDDPNATPTPDPNGTPTDEPNGTAPVAPQNIVIQPNQGRPAITWNYDTNAQWFQIWVGNANGTLHLEWYPVNSSEAFVPNQAPVTCASGVCSVKPNINPTAGTYQVWMQAWGPGGFATGGPLSIAPSWNGPFEFTVPSTPPGPVSSLTATVASGGKVSLSWSGVDRATWYNVWLGTGAPEFNARFFDWMLAENLGCENGGVCTLEAGVAVATGTTFNLTLPSGEYVWYVQSWGPGGFSTGGSFDPPLDPWVEADKFIVP